MNVPVQQWLDLKVLLVTGSGLDSETLRVLASVPAHLACALAVRRPVESLPPWLLLLLLTGGNEAITAYADRMADPPEIWNGARDLALTMALPTLLLLASRIRSLFPQAGARRTIIQLGESVPAPSEAIVDAEFEVIDAPEAARSRYS